MKKCLVALTAALVASSAFSADEMAKYAKIQYSRVDVDRNLYNIVSEDATPSALNFAYGVKFNDFVAVEGNLGLGWKDDKISNTTSDFDLDKMYGVSVIGYAPFNEYFRLFAKVGYSKLQFEDSEGQDANADGVAYGGGIEVTFTDRLGAMIEYVEYPDGDYKGADYKIEAESISLGLLYSF